MMLFCPHCPQGCPPRESANNSSDAIITLKQGSGFQKFAAYANFRAPSECSRSEAANRTRVYK